MANRYVASTGSNTSPYDTWAKAATTIATAVTGSAAGDVFYVAHDHSESYGANTTITFPGTAINPNHVLCVDKAGSVPPVAADLRTTGKTGTNTTFTLAIAGWVNVYGLKIAMGSGASGSPSLTLADGAGHRQNWKNCEFGINNTNTTPRITLTGSSAAHIELEDCKVGFGNASQGIATNTGATVIWRNSGIDTFVTVAAPFTSSVIPNVFIIGGTLGGVSPITLSGLDLSSVTGTLVSTTVGSWVEIINCKLHASVVIGGPASVASGMGAKGVRVLGSHSTTNAARNEIHRYQGALTTETTIVRTGGALDAADIPFSWKIVTNANGDERAFPFESFEQVLLNDETGSPKTLTVHIVTDNLSLTDAQAWLEVDYLGSALTPISTLITDAPATPLTAGAAQAASTAPWAVTGLTTPLYQKLEVTFTPQMKGMIRWRVKIARASTTAYVCPEPEFA